MPVWVAAVIGVAWRLASGWWITLMPMSAMSTLVTGVSDVLPQIVTGGCTLGAAWLTYRFGERQRARERASAANKNVEELAQELFEAVGALHLALRPAHNAWQPKLMSLGT